MNIVLKTAKPQVRGPACPECARSMTPYSCEGTILFKCENCHGLWLTGRKLGIFRNALAKFDLSELEIYLHAGEERTYVVSSCSRCSQVLDEFHYGYNSGVHIYRCPRCQGLWLPLRQMVRLMQSLKLSQDIAGDLRALLGEVRYLQRSLARFHRFVEFVRFYTR